jgi:hypothetical protein
MKYPTDYLGLANELPKNDKRHKQFKEQRELRGWDSTELWSLDSTIYKFLITRLTVFRENLHGYPANLTPEKWNDILLLMIGDLTILKNKQFDVETEKDLYTKVYNRFFKNFKRYLPHLWD